MHTRARITIASATLAALMISACGGNSVDTQKLESELAQKLSANAGVSESSVSVKCPDDEEAEKGKEFTCQLTNSNDVVTDVNVTLTDDEGGYQASVALSTEKLEQELASKLSASAGVSAKGVSVTCPGDIVPEKGKKFTCQLTDDGKTYEVDVTLTDDQGGFNANLAKQSAT